MQTEIPLILVVSCVEKASTDYVPRRMKTDCELVMDCSYELHRLRMSDFLQVYGGLHVIFNNAGIMDSGDDNVINTPDDVIDRTLAINVKGVIYGCR